MLRKITEELDYSLKKVASLREIVKHYPDTVIRTNNKDCEEIYTSALLKYNADIVRFNNHLTSPDTGKWYAHTAKVIGSIELFTIPDKFLILELDHVWERSYPSKRIIIQEYRQHMEKAGINEELIRKTDLFVLGFIQDSKNKKIDIDTSTLKNENLKKLLVLA